MKRVACAFLILFSLCSCNYKSIKLFKKSNNYNYHIVKPGDTLYSIAKKHHLKLETLVRINNIKPPFTLTKGQKLKLTTTSHAPLKQPAIAKNHQPYPTKNSSTTNKTINNSNETKHYNVEEVIKHSSNKNWVWPTNSKTIIKPFTASGPSKANGIDIIGNKGDPIVATADGKVVYSGNNLRGYGNLIIIKHDQDFLSAYAHNEKILVKEQQKITKGQQIATMGDSEANRVLLHFEIRYKGKPVNPVKILTKK